MTDLPAWIGPVQFSPFGAKWVAVRCPSDLAPLVKQAGALWEAGSGRWLVPRRQLNPLIRNLRRDTDPLFRWAGIDPDGEGGPEPGSGADG